MSAAVVSTSVMGSAATTIHLVGSDRASLRICSRKVRRWRRTGARRSGTAHILGAVRHRGSCIAVAGTPGTRPSTVWWGHHARRNTFPIDRATAIAMPGSTPSRATPAMRPSTARTRCGVAATAGPCREVGQRQRRGDHDRGQGRLGEVAQQPGNQQQHQGDRPAPTSPVTWVLAPACSATAVRAAGADGKPLEEPGADVGRADPDHLPVPVDLLARPGRERRGGRDRVGERHHRDADRAGHQQRQVGHRHARQRERRKALGRGPTRETPWSARLKALAARIETTTATSTAGAWEPAAGARR